MRNAWLKTFAALFCALSLGAPSAFADPAIGAMQTRKAPSEASSSIWPWSKKTAPAPPAGPPMLTQPRPTEQISAKQHPIKYLKAAVSEMPIGKKKDLSSPRATMPPPQHKQDAISLSTPTGPPSPEFFIYAAQVCEQQHDIPQARENFNRALSIWPGQVEVLRAAARMEDRQGNLPLAENLYQKAVASNPQHAGAFNDLGLCLARQGKLEPSAQVLEQAVQLQPTKPLYRNNAATVLVEMHQDQRALAHLAVVHGPAEANYNLGQLLVERNRAAEAAPYFQAALQQNPNMQQAQVALAKLQSTQIATTAAPTAIQTAPVTQMTVPITQPMTPQQGWTNGQQPSYPATAQAPTYNMSGSAQQPQYLPPVANRPGGPVRR